MPDQDDSLHRVRGFVPGVNLRVTRFAAPVPPHLTCGLCRVIPRTTFLLPCLHTLCESCVSHSLNDGNIVCPFDEEPFPGADCQKVHLQPATADRLKACCWNEARGCTFVGTLEAILAHYEQECTFHAVTCPRCNCPVLQQELPRHYRAECHDTATASAAREPAMRHGVVVSAEDIERRIDELKALMRDPYQDYFPALQSKMNEVLEEAGNVTTQIERISRDSIQREQRTTRAVQELQSQQRQLSAQLRTISFGESTTADDAGATSANEMPWRLEKRHILRKLELIASDSHAYLELLRTSAEQQLKRPIVEYVPLFPLSSARTVFMPPLMGSCRSEAEGYVVGITNIDDVVKSEKFIFLFTQWYRRDSYLQMATYGWRYFSQQRLTVCLKWGTTKEGSCSASPEANVCVKHPDYPEKANFTLQTSEAPPRAAALGFQETFLVDLRQLERLGLVREGKMTLLVSFKR
ncbi:uncharacterized protein LOC144159171 [Haemaphysalis longicornis]